MDRIELNLEKWDRVMDIALYVIATNATVRNAAMMFGIPKTTVHSYLTKLLPKINHVLFESVRKVLDQNKAERHIRGGMATRQKHLNAKL